MKKIALMLAMAIAFAWCYAPMATANEEKKPERNKGPVGGFSKTDDTGAPENKTDENKTKTEQKREDRKDFANFDKEDLPLFVRWAILKKYDADNDGELNDAERAEWRADWQAYRETAQARREAHKAEFLAKWDTDKDGKLSPEERAAARKQIEAEQKERQEAAILKRYDKNKDGVLSDSECRDWERDKAKRQERLQNRFDFDKDGKLEGNEKWAMEHRDEIRHWVKRLYDEDMDGTLNVAERAVLKSDLEEFHKEMVKRHGQENLELMKDTDYWKNFQEWQDKRHEQRKEGKEGKEGREKHPKGGLENRPKGEDKR